MNNLPQAVQARVVEISASQEGMLLAWRCASSCRWCQVVSSTWARDSHDLFDFEAIYFDKVLAPTDRTDDYVDVVFPEKSASVLHAGAPPPHQDLHGVAVDGLRAQRHGGDDDARECAWVPDASMRT